MVDHGADSAIPGLSLSRTSAARAFTIQPVAASSAIRVISALCAVWGDPLLPLLFARAKRACHPDRSDPAFSCARFLCAGSRSGGIMARLRRHLGRWDKTEILTPCTAFFLHAHPQICTGVPADFD